jgi:hypothetical protein
MNINSNRGFIEIFSANLKSYHSSFSKLYYIFFVDYQIIFGCVVYYGVIVTIETG